MIKKVATLLKNNKKISISTLSLVVVAAAGFGIYVKFFSEAATVTSSFEAETMSVPYTDPGSFWYQTVSDSAASGGKAKKIYSNYAASKTVSATQANSSVTIRARGERLNFCSPSAPNLQVTVDNKLIRTFPTVASTYTDYTVVTGLPPGSHVVKLGMSSDSPSCNKNLLLDKVTLSTAVPGKDALQSRVRTELSSFTNWLSAHNVKGYIGEVGWPDNRKGDSAQWNALGEAWFKDADVANLWVTPWATGIWWGTYNLLIYDVAKVPVVPHPQASIIEAHKSTANYWRGINVAGGAFSTSLDGSFSNHNPGTYGFQYIYDPQSTFNYVASRGYKFVRVEFRWERLQRTPGGALDPAELQRLKDVVARAGAAGLKVHLDLHNYGEYLLYDGTKGVRRTIGTTQLPLSNYTNLWTQLSNNFKTNSNVISYGLMNEPHDMAANGYPSGAKAWEAYSQAALNAIRAGGDTKLIMVPGYNWSGVQVWSATHPAPWITDSANNFRYEAHSYWDRDNSSDYPDTYNSEVTNAISRGYAATP